MKFFLFQIGKITSGLAVIFGAFAAHAETVVVPHAETTVVSYPETNVMYPETNVMPFKLWKSTRVDEARANLEKAQQLTVQPIQPMESSHSKNLPKLGQKMLQLQSNLDVAFELTINDYFVLYLGQWGIHLTGLTG